jgi:hypothetical protein
MGNPHLTDSDLSGPLSSIENAPFIKSPAGRSAWYTPLLLWLFLLLSSGTCHKSGSPNNNGKSCNLQTGTAVITYGVSVVYAASGQGGAAITTISYDGPAGTVYVSNPTLPWTTTVNLSTGNSAGISAVGTAPSGGVLTLSYAIQYPNNTLTDTTSCQH